MVSDVATAVWASATRTLTSYGTLVADVATAVWAYVVENGKTALNYMRIIKSSTAGKSAGGGTDELTYQDDADSKARITATVDDQGNRTAIVLDGD